MIRRFQHWILMRRIERAKRLLILIDRGTKKVGMPKYKRKQLWRDFIKSDSHGAIFDLLEGMK